MVAPQPGLLSLYFLDNGNSMAWAIRHLNMTLPYSFYVGLGFASMGFAVAASIGAKLAARFVEPVASKTAFFLKE